jgi:positive regulator of sigma E activity
MFFVAAVISITYLVVKFMEMRFIEKENKPLKLLVRDALLVYFSALIGLFVLDQLNPMLQNGGDMTKVTPVFTDNPGF